jgi:uncharacterized protein (AIM24 family)
VFLAERAYDVHLLNLTNAGLSISGKNVLAFSSSLDWNIERVEGGSMVARRAVQHEVARHRLGGADLRRAAGGPECRRGADVRRHQRGGGVVGDLQTQLKTSFKAGALIGRGSGEALQVSFYGQGFVIVQPSEGFPPVATG